MRTSLPGCGLHDGVQHGLPLLVRLLLRLLLLLLLLRRHLLPALQHAMQDWAAAQPVRHRHRVVQRRWLNTAAGQPHLCAAAVLAHQLLHAALPDGLQLRIVRLQSVLDG